MAKGCPHSDIRFCPLYIACHAGNGFGCDDGQLYEGKCAASRAMNYDQQVALLRVKVPGFVEQIEWRKAAEQLQEQRRRNLACNGIH